MALWGNSLRFLISTAARKYEPTSHSINFNAEWNRWFCDKSATMHTWRKFCNLRLWQQSTFPHWRKLRKPSAYNAQWNRPLIGDHWYSFYRTVSPATATVWAVETWIWTMPRLFSSVRCISHFFALEIGFFFIPFPLCIWSWVNVFEVYKKPEVRWLKSILTFFPEKNELG